MSRPDVIRAFRAVVLIAVSGALVLAPSRAVASEPPKVAVIVGPVGELSETYIEIAEMAAGRAEALGASVARAYTPDATPERVLAAVDGASIVVYLGHGVGVPNPYSDNPHPGSVNGWGLQGPEARGDHADSASDGTLRYYGEEWIAANAKAAPGFVMIYSNACYAPGAGEGHHALATEAEALARVSGYSRSPLQEMGASAYFATDFYGGAAELIERILSTPGTTYGDLFTAEPRYEAEAVTRLPHASVDGLEVWLQRSSYFDGKVDYWYAFAGDPVAAALSSGRAIVEPAEMGTGPALPVPLEYRDPHSY